jgi:autotransporter translocation and assembly factor TamB
MHVGGDRVLAADIPGARVIVTPNLNLVRTAERVTLNGDVTIPKRPSTCRSCRVAARIHRRHRRT